MGIKISDLPSTSTANANDVFIINQGGATKKITKDDLQNQIENPELEERVTQIELDTGTSIELSMNTSTYVLTANLKNKDDTVVSTATVDLPLESLVKDIQYDSTTKEIVFILQDGTTRRIPLSDLISGLQTEITTQNKLSSDLVDDTNKIHKFVTASEKTSWNAKYKKPNTGIPKTDLANDVQTSLNKADTAIQEHQDISGKEDKSNKVTELTSESTDTQYPSAKAVYDSQAEQDTEIEKLQTRVTNLEETVNSELEDGVATGTEITVNDSATADASLLPNGNTSQTQTNGYQLIHQPSEVDTVETSGLTFESYPDGRCKIYGTTTANEQKVLNINTGKWELTGTSHYSNLSAGTYNYKIHYIKGTFARFRARSGSSNLTNYSDTGEFTLENDITDFNIYFYLASGNTIDVEFKIMLEKGTVAHDWEEYTGGQASPNPTYTQPVQVLKGSNTITISNSDNTKQQIKTLTLPNGMEMCKIGDYKDEFVKDLSTGKWYKDEKINKAILIDTENWADRPNFNACDRFVLSTNIIPIQTQKCYSNYFITVNSDVSNTDIGKIILNNGTQIIVNFSEKGTTTLGQFKDWLSSHNVELYYVRANPQLIEITDTTLIAELDELLEIRTYYGQTNVTVEAEDLPPMMTLNYKKSNRVLRSEIDTIKARLDLLEE